MHSQGELGGKKWSEHRYEDLYLKDYQNVLELQVGIKLYV